MGALFRLPDLGEGIAEAEIVAWLVSEGNEVQEHQAILQVETDKAVVDVPAPASGRIGRIRHQPGDVVHVGEVLVSILEEGESDETMETEEEEERAERDSSSTVVGALDDRTIELPAEGADRESSAQHRRVLATPAVRRIARELGVPIETVRGSGNRRRVTEADVREAAEQRAATGADSEGRDSYGPVERRPLRGIRRTIARRLRAAVSAAALATHMDELDVSGLVARLRADDAPPGGPFPWIVRATARALLEHPRLNAALDEDHEEIVIRRYVNIGIAVDTPEGLMVPVLHQADELSVETIGRKIEEMATRCRGRTIGLERLRGATFSVSNIGAYGGLFATPIPNHPEVAILAVGRIREQLAREPDGSIGSAHRLPLSLTFDHRVLDGADAARFVRAVEQGLEDG